MFKKPEQTLLIIIMLLFVGVIAGVFIGKQASKDEICLSVYETSISDQPNSTNPKDEAPEKLNINFANEKELAMLPGIGDTYAKRIVAYREDNGPFIATSDLLNVKGIGQKRFDSIEKYITVGG